MKPKRTIFSSIYGKSICAQTVTYPKFFIGGTGKALFVCVCMCVYTKYKIPALEKYYERDKHKLSSNMLDVKN